MSLQIYKAFCCYVVNTWNTKYTLIVFTKMTYCKENMLVSTAQELEKHKFWITLKNKNVYCFLDG